MEGTGIGWSSASPLRRGAALARVAALEYLDTLAMLDFVIFPQRTILWNGGTSAGGRHLHASASVTEAICSNERRGSFGKHQGVASIVREAA